MASIWDWVKFGTLVFWAVWMSLVWLTNLLEALKLLGWLPARWKFASSNFELIQKTTSVYTLPVWLDRVFFGGAILWQLVASLLLWRGVVLFPVLPAADLGMGVSLGLAAAFLLADEVFHSYGQETSHRGIFISQLVSLIALHL